jgi:hypothetical protein
MLPFINQSAGHLATTLFSEALVRLPRRIVIARLGVRANWRSAPALICFGTSFLASATTNACPRV